MKETSRLRVLRALVEFGAAAICLVAFLSTIFVVRALFGMFLFLFGFMALTADGIISLMRSRQLGRFR
jgi:hypothetical protein